MKKTLKLLAFALVAYIVFLLVTLPANRVYQQFAEQLPSSIKFYGVSGTIWSGKAELVTLASQQYRNASWQFQWAGLVKGKALFNLDFDNGQSQIKGNVGVDVFGNMVARELLIQQELTDIQALAKVSPITVGGKMGGRINSLVVKQDKISEANATMTIIDAAFLLPRRTPWGNFKIDIESPDGNTKIKIKDQGGPLLADGLVSVSEAGEYDVNLAVEAASGASNDLIRGLEFFGRPGSDGKTRLKYKGSLPQLLGQEAPQTKTADKPT